MHFKAVLGGQAGADSVEQLDRIVVSNALTATYQLIDNNRHRVEEPTHLQAGQPGFCDVFHIVLVRCGSVVSVYALLW